MKDDELLSIGEVSRILHLHPRTVSKMIKEGKIFAIVISGDKRKTYRIMRSELDRFFNQEYAKHQVKIAKL